MINGKFFSGLTPKMLDRNTIGPNRQQSNLFWPDESDVDSASESRSKQRQKTQQASIGSNSSYNADLDTRELVKKQLTSKIEFYDLLDDTPIKNNVSTSTMQPTVEETSARKNKLEGFTSKIEFYDYADEVKANLPKTDKNSKQDVEKNSKNSPKTIDKKIKFIENVLADEEIAQPKGILRNNEKSSQEQSRKRLIKKRNLSKSVENLSFRSQDLSDDDEDDCIKVIENDVKSVAINDRKLREKDGRQSSRKEEFANYRSSRSNIKMDRPQTPINHNYDDGLDSPEEQIDENFYRKSNREQTVIYHEVRQDSHSDRVDSDRGNSARSATSRPPTQHQYKNDNFSRMEKPINCQNSSARSQQSDQPPPDQQPLHNRSHRHLQSSIFFGNDIEPTADRPPKTVRSSAVMRVSVGLPD